MIVMDKSEQERRKRIWKEYQNAHRDILLEFATKMGFNDPNAPEEFVLAESYSRALAARAVLANYPDCRLFPMPLYWHFDFLLVDGEGNERGIEAKFRLNDSDEYPTDNISFKKKVYNKVSSETIPIDLYCTFFDGKTRVYDLNGKSEVSTWTHSRTTATEGELITDQSLSYNPMDALWTTTVSIPL